MHWKCKFIIHSMLIRTMEKLKIDPLTQKWSHVHDKLKNLTICLFKTTQQHEHARDEWVVAG